MTSTEPVPTLLRQLVDAKGWRSYETFRWQFEQAAAQLASERAGTRFASYTVSRTQYERWLGGKVVRSPYPDAQAVLEFMFKVPVKQLLAPPSTSTASQHLTRDADRHSHTLESEITMSGHESSEHAASASRSVDDTSIEQLQADIAVIARRYPFRPVYESFVAAKRVRDLAYALLDRTSVPSQETDLYMVIGQACGILATASFDLGYPESAAEQSRSTYTYGKMIGHNGLCAWALGMRALICYWDDRPYQSLDLIGKGLAIAPQGSATLRLRAIESRAFAHLGDQDGTAESARLAHEQEGSSHRDLIHDEIGGEFSFDDARLARCLGSAWVRLSEPAPAIQESRTALEIYRSRPEAVRMPKVEAEAHIDLAHAYVLQGSLDAAEQSLRTVLATEPDGRVEGITSRLVAVHERLIQPAFRGAREAVELTQRIEAFNALSARGSLPAIGPGS